MMGLIHVGPEVGFGVYGALCPALSHVTTHHLQQLPAAVKEEFPHADSIALAGRLPGLMTASGACVCTLCTLQCIQEFLPNQIATHPNLLLLDLAAEHVDEVVVMQVIRLMLVEVIFEVFLI